MNVSKEAQRLSDRLGAFDSTLELVQLNFQVVDTIASSTFESEHARDLINWRRNWIANFALQELRLGIFNYASAAYALIDQALRGRKPDGKKTVYELFRIKGTEKHLESYVTTHFIKDNTHGLVKALRDFCTHHRMPTINGSVDLVSATGAITISRDQLLEFGDVDNDFRSHLTSLEPNIQIVPILRKHHVSLLSFHGWIHAELGSLWQKEFEEIRAERERRFKRGTEILQIELREALALGEEDIVDSLQFKLAGFLSPAQKLELVPLEGNPVAWVSRAYEFITDRCPMPADIETGIREILVTPPSPPHPPPRTPGGSLG